MRCYGTFWQCSKEVIQTHFLNWDTNALTKNTLMVRTHTLMKSQCLFIVTPSSAHLQNNNISKTQMCIVNILLEFPLIPSDFPQWKEYGYTVHIKKIIKWTEDVTEPSGYRFLILTNVIRFMLILMHSQ